MTDKLHLSDEEWRARLSPEQYQILRQHGTERAFTGKYEANKAAGMYNCAGCGQPLFASETKYNSGSGWPSFTAPVAPESIASVFSLGLADAVDLAATTPLPTRLNNLEIRVRSVTGTERLAPLFFVSPDQINYQIPAGTNPGTATVFVNGVTRGPLTYGTVQVAAIAPGLFTANANGQGVPAAVALRIKADGSQSYEPVAEFSAAQNRFVPRPLDLGAPGERVFLLLFGTGIRGRSSLDAVSLKVGDQDANVSFAGAQGGFAGLDQINVELPASLRGRGEVSVNCAISGRQANTVTLHIK